MSYLQPWEGTAIRKSAIGKGKLGHDFSEIEALLFQQKVSPLTKLDVSPELMAHYHDMFTYYVYLNRFIWPLIKFAGNENVIQKFVKSILDMLLDSRLRNYRY